MHIPRSRFSAIERPWSTTPRARTSLTIFTESIASRVVSFKWSASTRISGRDFQIALLRVKRSKTDYLQCAGKFPWRDELVGILEIRECGQCHRASHENDALLPVRKKLGNERLATVPVKYKNGRPPKRNTSTHQPPHVDDVLHRDLSRHVPMSSLRVCVHNETDTVHA